MSLSLRIYLGMGAMVALIVLLGGFAAFQTNRLAETFVEYRETARQSLLAGDFLEDMFEARLASSKYRLTKNEAQLDDVQGNIGELLALNTELEAIISHYDSLDDVAQLPVLLDEYQQLMLRAYEFQKQRNSLVAVAAETGLKARRQLSEVMETALRDNDAVAAAAAGEAGINLMLARYYLEKYLVDNQLEDAERSTKEIQLAREGLTNLMLELQNPRRREVTQTTMEDLNTFDTVSADVAKVIAQRNATYARMDAIGPEALALIEQTVDAVVDAQNTLGPAGAAMAQQSIKVVLILVAVAALLGATLAAFTGRSISSRLATVTKDMKQLADGNLDVDITESEDNHEIGQMTNAMVVFLDNARKARDLDLEVKEKERLENELKEQERARETELEREKRAREDKERDLERARMKTMQDFQKEMQKVLDEAASGNFSNRMSTEINDEGLVELAKIINRLLEQTESNIGDVLRSIGELSQGNLGVRIEGERKGDFLTMKNDFNTALTSLSQTMADIMESGTTVSSTSAHLESSANDMSKRAENVAASVEETSAAVEQITASIRQVVDNAKSADAATGKVRKGASETRKVSDKTEESITQISDASNQINSVVKVIEDIAFQINLLALNAGVEAARAGEAGRGFSVVASEVRALAQRSQEAVQEIGQVIDQNNRSVESGVEQVALSRTALEAIIGDVEVASEQISEIAMAVEQQSTGIEEVNTAIQSIDSAAQSNAASLEEMTAASASMSNESKILAEALAQFHGVPSGGTSKGSKTSSAAQMVSYPRIAVRKKVAAVSGSSSVSDSGWDEF